MINSRAYRILGVRIDEDITSIKRAYRKLASKYHPDKNHNNKDANSLFVEAKCAYEDILKQKKHE